MTNLDEYIDLMMKTARSLWGTEAEEIRQHVETTASSIWRNSQAPLSIETEPAIRLRHREQP
jgi:hypothetical protein